MYSNLVRTQVGEMVTRAGVVIILHIWRLAVVEFQVKNVLLIKYSGGLLTQAVRVSDAINLKIGLGGRKVGAN